MARRWEQEMTTRKARRGYQEGGFDSVFFCVYTNARLSPVKAERRDLTVGLFLNTSFLQPRSRMLGPAKRELGKRVLFVCASYGQCSDMRSIQPVFREVSERWTN